MGNAAHHYTYDIEEPKTRTRICTELSRKQKKSVIAQAKKQGISPGEYVRNAINTALKGNR